MAAHTEFPPPGAPPIVRGDPTAMVVRFQIDHVDVDITTWTFRSFVRDRLDGLVIGECETFTVVSADDLPDLFPGAPGSTPAVLLAHWTPAQTQMWKAGFVCDIEQLTPTVRTWVIYDTLRVDKDVSYLGAAPARSR